MTDRHASELQRVALAAVEHAKEAAREAGAAIRPFFRTRLDVRDKDPDAASPERCGHPVTDADLAANAILEERLARFDPVFGWLSEESIDGAERLSRDWVWIVDPLDGTRDFTNGIPEFAVSVGVSFQGCAVAGVLYHPIRDELTWGVTGLGTVRERPDGRAIGRLTACTDLGAALVLCSRTDLTRGRLGLWEAAGLRLVPMGSAALKLGLVATGSADASFTPRPRSEWDICAGVAIVEAAGGVVTDGAGRPFRFNKPHPEDEGVYAANAALLPQLLALGHQRLAIGL